MARTPLLRDSDLSAIYKSADELAGRGQRRTKLLVRVELWSLIIAAAAGVVPSDSFNLPVNVFAIAAALAFLVALVSTAFRSLRKPEEDWYVGRAAAESVRTLGWRYALRGDPFPESLGEVEAGKQLLKRLKEILDELGQNALPTAPVEATDITAEMKALRAADLETRKDAYKHDRISDQLAWYNRRAGDHEQMAKLWFIVTAGASALGLIAAVFKAANVFEPDLLGVFGAVASAAIAWNQLNQHRNQVSAYTVTAHELRLIRDEIDLVDETLWPSSVSDWEDAISREHTLWLARRGHPGLIRR